jgi:hypothetical protein
MKIQRTTSQFVFKNVLVNPFMTDRYFHVFLHPTADLLRTPFFAYQSFNKDPSTTVNTGPDFSLPSVFRKCIGLFGAIVPSTTISYKFSTNGRFVNANHFGNLRLCKSCFKQRIYSVSFFQRELAVVFHLCTSYLTVRKVRSLQRLRFFYNQSLSCT